MTERTPMITYRLNVFVLARICVCVFIFQHEQKARRATEGNGGGFRMGWKAGERAGGNTIYSHFLSRSTRARRTGGK